MKTQQQAQEIFDVLVTQLSVATCWNIHHITHYLHPLHEDIVRDTPLDHFVKNTRENLTEEDVSEAFLRQVYANAFYTDPIPKGRNHLAMTCELVVNGRPASSVLRFWIDLDKVAHQLNTHLRINPLYSFEVKYRATSSSSSCAYNTTSYYYKESSAVNSVENPSSVGTSFLIGCIVSGMISGYALLLAVLGAISLIALSTPVVYTAAGIGLVAAAASYYFFKAQNNGVNTTVTTVEEPNAVNIEDLFKNHFAATVGIGVDETTILPQDHVEIIEETALRI